MSPVLVPEERLSVSDDAMESLISSHPGVNWHTMDAASRRAYGRHILFSDTAAQQSGGFPNLSPAELFYNSYYWLLVFSKRYQAKSGYDAGIEQQAFKALEAAPPGVDWKIVEEISRSAALA
jgi:hypothetical protein